MSIGRKHKQTVLEQIAADKAKAESAASSQKQAESTNAPALPVEVLSPRIGVANKQRALASLGKIRLVESAEDLPMVSGGVGVGELAKAARKSDFNIVLEALNGDIDRLHEIPSIPEKQALKRELLAKYLPIVQQYIESGAKFANQVLVHCVIWLIDVADFEQAITLADVAIAQNQKTPPYIKRELTDFVVEEVAEWACRQAKAKQSASPAIDQTMERVDAGVWLVDNLIIKAKLYRYAGMVRDNFEEFEAALALYEKAQATNEQAGCKGRIKAIKEKLGKN